MKPLSQAIAMLLTLSTTAIYAAEDNKNINKLLRPAQLSDDDARPKLLIYSDDDVLDSLGTNVIIRCRPAKLNGDDARQELLDNWATDSTKIFIQRLDKHGDNIAFILNDLSKGATVLHSVLEQAKTVPFEALKVKVESLVRHNAWPLIPDAYGMTPYDLIADKENFPNEEHRKKLTQLLDSLLESNEESDKEECEKEDACSCSNDE